ncbi:Protein translocase subunit SecA [Planctomycetes bacterium LzC2]|uniref:Protein translocase subunit SecA n=2 Tax=Alienimonas chondri TaxID=2681879 RepID=A0ABX1VH91_9PLAN|nr:preprotein translocase subunit SecA [Alienimonas chondri]NNJ27493.1 Protein translocase subunit SecA [Alienimonas chondri]
MEQLDRIGDVFEAATGGITNAITKLFGSSNERRVRQLGFVRGKDGSTTVVPGSTLDKINKLEPELEKLSDEQLKNTAADFRARLEKGETLDDLLPEAFARVREASKRVAKMRHYDVQMIGGAILHQGMIAEMTTGEGKTLVSSGPAFLNALAGHVHVITVNDYLAKRDMEWIGPIHTALGLTVGAIQSGMQPPERQAQYACDITYGTSNEFGFDYLRDNMKPRLELQVQGPLDYAIVDEIDNILIDEARTPLIISGPAHDDVSRYPVADRIARQLKAGSDFEIKEKERTCHLTESGVRRAEELAGVESFYTAGNMEWPHFIDNALKAHHLYKRDDQYMVRNGQVIIVDENTGRPMEGRQWSDGLHQAVEAKEGVKIKPETQTYATVTLQNFFKLYGKLSGMTGTAMTEADEFLKIYKLDVVAVPTNRPLQRQNHPDLVCRTEKEKWDAVAEEVAEEHAAGRPVLIGTTSIEASEKVSNKLNKRGVKHFVLNAKHIEKESELIAQAGRPGAVTIATNMAGRGTDIILGGNPEYAAWEQLRHTYDSRLDVPKDEWDGLIAKIREEEGMKEQAKQIAEAGGLHVIGTERHDSRRIDNQLRGRAGRQGDPGSSRFYVSLEDRLMRVFAGEFVQRALDMAGMKEGEFIESKMVSRRIEGAQKKVEERHFDQRKNLLEYDEVMDDQRKQVYRFRQDILEGANCRDIIHEMIRRQVDRRVDHFYDRLYPWKTAAEIAHNAFGLDMDADRIEGSTLEQLMVILRDEALEQADASIAENVEVNLSITEDEEGMQTETYNWNALSRWANGRFGLNTNDRELKKIGPAEVEDYLRERAHQSIDRSELGQEVEESLAQDKKMRNVTLRDDRGMPIPPQRTVAGVLEEVLREDYPRISLAHFLGQQFALRVDPADFADIDNPDEVKAEVMNRLDRMYKDKEVMFPVTVGLTRFLQDGSGGGDRLGLARWASGRFEKPLDPEAVESSPKNELEGLLADASRGYFINGEVAEKVDDTLDRVYGGRGVDPMPRGDAPDRTRKAEHPEDLAPLIDWANKEFEAGLEAAEVATLPKARARQVLLKPYEERYRPELAHAERLLILEVLDTAWKDHLYHMDQVRSGIGLSSYAQKDPKTEYKREGRKAFNDMWDRVGEQVTRAIFRLERDSKQFVGNLWQLTEQKAIHAAPTADTAPAPDHAGGVEGRGERQRELSTNRGDGEGEATVAPIKNTAPDVGRNDPCPCGSGKKYKKCHGADA